MIVLLISQCNKRALVTSRRILDQFAERKGERTWQTSITLQGLATLRKMLRKTARRNTAVACHWIKSAAHPELLWVVGNCRRFNPDGTVPTNTTGRDILRAKDENQWRTMEDVALLAGIAGLFHDFGKANPLFQGKLKPGYKGPREPYRHEWVSLRLFQAFVGASSDQQWLEQLHNASELDEQVILNALVKDGVIDQARNPFKDLPPLARAVAWLVLSHHRLPKWPAKSAGREPKLSQIDHWMDSNRFRADWYAPQQKSDPRPVGSPTAVWTFEHGTPLRSQTWCLKARSLASRALKRPELVNSDWFKDPFTLHLSRMVLMLSDHHYSAHDITPKWQDGAYHAYANTDRRTGRLKQKLDEHLVGVGHNAVLLAKTIPALRQTLPAITRHRGFKRRALDSRFRWQNKAYELACGLRKRADEHGFFGVNMASTGCGKTFANGRIMYGLADEKLGCRFAVALGLRTLTLQTGDALRSRLGLDEDDLAVLIGSMAVRQLHDFNSRHEKVPGSESAEDLFSEHQYVKYEGSLDDGRLSEWLKKSPTLHQMVSAPILVSTIDRLMPATEGERGGKQIAPMLRLLTSDLVLDEPDDFDLADLPALSRLVHWAGMLGSRVLISSATLPPVLVKALFDAYAAGRKAFQKARGEPGLRVNVCCAWFDEYGAKNSDHATATTFAKAHQHFVQGRVRKLLKAAPVRQAVLQAVLAEDSSKGAAVKAIAQAVYTAMHTLHRQHSQVHPGNGKRVSIGLVRMANINPLVAVSRQLMNRSPQDDHRIHYCVYHSQYPLAVRSAIERRLDDVLTRHDPDSIWDNPCVRAALLKYPEANHLFVVIATSVAEVGRDHDYDWAIPEPSSMRSLIQIAGRVQRHRSQVPTAPNLRVLSHNYRALIGRSIAFEKPGFESDQFPLSSHDMNDLVETDQLEVITSIPRITERNPLVADKWLADLEHAHLAAKLFGCQEAEMSEYAALWWQHTAQWCFELQRRMPFRAPPKDGREEGEYVLFFEDEGELPVFNEVDDWGGLKPCIYKFKLIEPELSQGISLWGDNDIVPIITELAESEEMSLAAASRKFGVLRLRGTEEGQQWLFNAGLGVHGALD